MASEVLLIMLLALHASQIAQMADLNCGFLDQDNGIYLVNNYYHFKQNATAYFERTTAIANCEITAERYTYLRNNRIEVRK